MSYDYTSRRVSSNVAYFLAKQNNYHYSTPEQLLELERTSRITANPYEDRQKYFEELQPILKLEQPTLWDIDYLKFDLVKRLEGQYVNNKEIIENELAIIKKIVAEEAERDVRKGYGGGEGLNITGGMFRQILSSGESVPVSPFSFGYDFYRNGETFDDSTYTTLAEKDGYIRGQYEVWFSDYFHGMVTAQFQSYLERKKEEIESGKLIDEEEDNKHLTGLKKFNLRHRVYLLEKLGLFENDTYKQQVSKKQQYKVIANVLKCSPDNVKKILSQMNPVTEQEKKDVTLFLNNNI